MDASLTTILRLQASWDGRCFYSPAAPPDRSHSNVEKNNLLDRDKAETVSR